MAFENKTVEYVDNLIVNGLEQELNVKFRLLPKSFIRVLSKVLAGVYVSLYKLAAWIFLQLFVDTACFDTVEVLGRRIRPLVLWGELVGVGEPGEATQWTGEAVFSVVAVGTYLEEGTALRSSVTGKIYLTTETRLLANNSEIIPVKCAEAGTAGNLTVQDELQTVSPLYNVERKAIVQTVGTEARDAEGEGSYRNRVRNRWRVQPQGGSLSDYRKWSSEVAGVYETYIYNDKDSSSGVLIYVAADPAVTPSRIPGKDVLLQVGEACSFNPETGEARKPMGAVLDPSFDGTYANIRPVIITTFDVYITGYSDTVAFSEFKSMAKANIDSYFAGREPYIRGLSVDTDRRDRISDNNLIGIVNDIAESLTGYFEELEIRKDGSVVESYKLGDGELVSLGKLYINGQEV